MSALQPRRAKLVQSGMATQRQRQAARKNVKKAQRAWKRMSSRQRARAQPQGRRRRRPGSGGSGDYFHVTVRPKSEFRAFRTHDVGRSGHVQRVAGRRSSGSWSTQKWLIHKDDAHVENGRLVADASGARKVLQRLGSLARHARADHFKAKPRPTVPERAKPTPAQRRARRANAGRARRARRPRKKS